MTQRLASIRSELLQQRSPLPADSASPGPGPSRTSNPTDNRDSLYLTIANWESRHEPLLLAELPAQQLRATDATLEKLGKLNLSEPIERPPMTQSSESDAKTNQLLKKLYSDKTQERQDARTSLVSQGTVSLEPLLKMLQVGNMEPRLRISLAYALDQIPQPVVVTDEQNIRVLTNLIGDDQREVRQYVSQFLMKLSDGNTVQMLRRAILAIPHTEAAKTGDAVYNAVVILGTWIRVLPPELDEFKKTLAKDLTNLQAEAFRRAVEKNLPVDRRHQQSQQITPMTRRSRAAFQLGNIAF